MDNVFDDRRGMSIPGSTSRVRDTYQNAISSILRTENQEHAHKASTDIAEIIEVNTEHMTVDLKSWSGPEYTGIPIMGQYGLIDNEIYGELDPPSKGEFVLVAFVSEDEGRPYIIGKILPWATEDWTTQKAVNSDDKQFTLKLIEEDLENVFRKIFKSGTTLEVDDNGTTILETPSGAYVKIDEDDQEGSVGVGSVTLSTPSGTVININEEDTSKPGSIRVTTPSGVELLIDEVKDGTTTLTTPSGSGITIDETQSGTVTVESASGAKLLFNETINEAVFQDSRGNKVQMKAAEAVFEAFGNVLSLKPGMVDINNGSAQVLQ